MVGIAQLVEHLVVVQDVAGSNPVTHPNEALLIYGAPTRDQCFLIAWQLPGGKPQADLAALDDTSIEQIDALGHALTADRADLLWEPRKRSWQTHLPDIVLPSPVRHWLSGTEPNAIAVLVPPVLTHLPIEALLVAGEPVGIRAAVARLTAPTTDGRASHSRRSVSGRWREGESHSVVAIPAVMRQGWSASPEHLRVPGQPKRSTPGVARDRSFQARKFAPS